MKKSSVRWQTFVALFSLWFLVGCGRGKNENPSVAAPKDSPSKAESNSGEAPLKLEAAMIAHLKIEPVSERTLPSTITATGKIAFNEDRLARILAPVAGQVVNLRVKVGDGVAAGQPLFYVTSREASAAVTEYLENRKDLELASKTYDMTKDLYDHESASRIALQQAENDLAKAKARMARSEYALKALNLSVDGSPADTKIPVQAPLGGKVVERAVTEGQFVQPDSNALMVIADLTNLWVLADIYETSLNRIKLGQKAEVTTAAYPDERFVATVSRISDVVDPNSHTIKVRFLVANPAGRLKPEMFASVNIYPEEKSTALAIPATAAFTESGQNFVYVQTAPQEFTRRLVEVTPDASGQLRVKGGLKAGEKIVTERALLLRQESTQQKE